MIKTVIMDFDGIVIDTENIWFDLYNEYFKSEFDYEFTRKEFLMAVGSTTDQLNDYFKQNTGLQVDFDPINENLTPEFRKRSLTLPARPGIPEFIQAVKANNLKLSLATSSHAVMPTKQLERLNLIKYFDELVSRDDVEQVKPAPDLFLKVLELTDTYPEEALILEDSENGLNAADKIPVSTIIYPNEVTKIGHFSTALAVVDDARDAIKYFK